MIRRRFTVGLIAVAFIAGVVWTFIDSRQATFIVVSILIVACPFAIALSVPFTYGNGIRIFGRKGVYLRSINVIEPMVGITDVVFDKTGTLTFNNQSKVVWDGTVLLEEDENVIQQITNNSSHPLSRQISSYLKSSHGVNFDSFSEISGKGIEVIHHSDKWRVGHKDWVGAKVSDHKTRVYISKNDVVLGAYIFENIYRNGLKDMFNKLSEKAKIHILSGDNDSEREKLLKLLPEGSEITFNQKPESKLEYIRNIQGQNKKVMMLG